MVRMWVGSASWDHWKPFCCWLSWSMPSCLRISFLSVFVIGSSELKALDIFLNVSSWSKLILMDYSEKALSMALIQSEISISLNSWEGVILSNTFSIFVLFTKPILTWLFTQPFLNTYWIISVSVSWSSCSILTHVYPANDLLISYSSDDFPTATSSISSSGIILSVSLAFVIPMTRCFSGSSNMRLSSSWIKSMIEL